MATSTLVGGFAATALGLDAIWVLTAVVAGGAAAVPLVYFSQERDVTANPNHSLAMAYRAIAATLVQPGMLAIVTYYASAFVTVRLGMWVVQSLVAKSTSTELLGIITFAFYLISSASAFGIRYLSSISQRAIGHRLVVIAATGLAILALGVSIPSPYSTIAIGTAVILIGLLNGLYNPILVTWSNEASGSAFRATTVATLSSGSSLIYTVIAIVLKPALVIINLPAMLVCLATLMGLVIVCLRQPVRASDA
jgi:hypothetical protein